MATTGWTVFALFSGVDMIGGAPYFGSFLSWLHRSGGHTYALGIGHKFKRSKRRNCAKGDEGIVYSGCVYLKLVTYIV